MANLQLTEIKVYSDSSATTQIGNTIITNEPNSLSVKVDSSTLGATINYGEKYWVKARCKDVANQYSEWTDAQSVVTLPRLVISPSANADLTIDVAMTFTMNTAVVQIVSQGVYVSEYADGRNARKITKTGVGILNFSVDKENTNYYIIGWYNDSLGREWMGNWANAASVTSGYLRPQIQISDIAATYYSISGIIDVQTNETVDAVGVNVIETQDMQTLYELDLTATTGAQTFNVVSGQRDRNGTLIDLQESTDYIFQFYVDTPTYSESKEIEVATIAQDTVSITLGVENITTNSARITWLVDGNNPSAIPTVTVYLYGNGQAIYPQTENAYGQWSAIITGLQSQTQYRVYGEAEVPMQEFPAQDEITFTTL